MNVPILDLQREYRYMKSDIDAAIAGCLEHQRWIFGPEVKELEVRIAEYLGAEHCAGTSSGTEALVLSLRAIAIVRRGEEFFEKGDKIITTPFTFTATGDAILRAGAEPVFVDIDSDTFNIDPGAVCDYLERSNGDAVGILPVHLYGNPCNMNELNDIASQYDLFVVEDVAQAFGADTKEGKTGSLGTTGAFSFFPSKNLGGFGDGGMVSTDDGEIAETVRRLIKHGGKDKYNVNHIGYNARLDSIQAAVLLARMKYIDEFNGKRMDIARRYGEGMEGIEGLDLPAPAEGTHVYHQFTLNVKNGKRDELKEHLSDNGIGSMIYYPVSLHEMAVFRERCTTHGDLKNTKKACGRVLSLPVEPLLTNDEIDHVVDSINKFFGR